MKRLLLALLLLTVTSCVPVYAQGTFQNPWGIGTTLPAKCTVGQLFFKTNATAGQNIYECASTNTWTQQLNSGGGSGSPGGSDTQVQFNDGGSTFGGDAGMTYNKTTDTLTVGNIATAGLVDGYDVGTVGAKVAGLPDHAIQDAQCGGASAGTPRSAINFIFASGTPGVACADNSGSDRKDVTFTMPPTGATPALDNLASVSINSALLAQTGIDLGSTVKPFRDLFLFGGGTYGTNYFRFTGTPTSTRTITLFNASDTVVGKATTDTLTNKTYDTAGSGNAFSINGQSIASVSGNTSKVATAGTPASGKCLEWDSNGNVVTSVSNAACGSGGAAANNAALASSVADKTVANSTTETSLVGTLASGGSLTTAANYFAAGTSLVIQTSGYFGSTAADTLDIKIKAGSTVVGSTGATGYGALSSQVWRLYAIVTCRTAGASGTFIVNTILETTGSTLAAQEAKILKTSTVTLDTTGTLAWDVTATWAGVSSPSATDTITGTNFVMFSPGTGIADPGGNGFLDRTALNTVVNRTFSATAPVAITNGGGGGNPVISITGAANQVLAGSGPAFTGTPALTSVTLNGATSGGSTQISDAVGGSSTVSWPQSGDTLAGLSAAVCMLASDYTASDVSTAQKLFNCSANGQFTVVANMSYRVSIRATGTNTGTTSHTWALAAAGTATYTMVGFYTCGTAAAGTLQNGTRIPFPSNAAVVCSNASTSATENFSFDTDYIMRVTGAGTFIPQFKASAQPGLSGTPGIKILTGSFVTIIPLGLDNAATRGAWN